MRPGLAPGVVAIEFALLTPVLGLALLAVVLAGVHAADQASVQDAARTAVRLAATTRDGSSVVEIARAAAAPRDVFVNISPARRRAGQPVTVSVEFTRDVGWLHWTVRGSAVAVTEPRRP